MDIRKLEFLFFFSPYTTLFKLQTFVFLYTYIFSLNQQDAFTLQLELNVNF